MHLRDIVGILPVAITVMLVVLSRLARSARAVNQPPPLDRPAPVPGAAAPQWQAAAPPPQAPPIPIWPPQAGPPQAWPPQPTRASPTPPIVVPRAPVPPRRPPPPQSPDQVAAAAAAASQEAAITALFATPQALAAAMVGAEVLGPPLSLRER